MAPSTIIHVDSDKPQNWLRRLHSYIPFVSLPNPLCTPLTTKRGSKTTCTETTQKAVENKAHGLNVLFQGTLIWERCWYYIRPDLFDPSKHDAPPPACSRIWDIPNQEMEGPPPSHQQGIEDLKNLLASTTVQRATVLTTNSSAKEATNRHIYEILNAALKLRYKNSVLTEVDPRAPFTTMSNKPLAPENAAKHGAFYPSFNQVIRDHHEVPAPNASGYTDKLLFLHPRPRRREETLKSAQRMVSEGKTPWTYTTQELVDIFTGHQKVLNDQGEFHQYGRETHGGNALLKQLWGQCDSLGPDVGFATNLENVFIVVRYPPKPEHREEERAGIRQSSRLNPLPAPKKETSGFIVSPLMRWDDPRLLTCLIGLCYMAIDEDVWGKTIQEMLCSEVVENPEGHRIRRAPVAQ